MTQSDLPLLLLIGEDPSLEYLLKRYALAGGCEVRNLRDLPQGTDILSLCPSSVWFSSVDVLKASQAIKVKLASMDVPIVVCSSTLDDTHAIDLGADYVLMHPITYDRFVSVLTGKD